MTLFSIRHGAKESTKEIDPHIGHTDPPLFAQGIVQSQLLVEWITLKILWLTVSMPANTCGHNKQRNPWQPIGASWRDRQTT